MTPAIAELIRRRRGQMFLHSYIYYVLGGNLISDDKWQQWANELRDLQNTHGTTVGYYDEQFKDWTGDTGMHLQPPESVKEIAKGLMAK